MLEKSWNMSLDEDLDDEEGDDYFYAEDDDELIKDLLFKRFYKPTEFLEAYDNATRIINKVNNEDSRDTLIAHRDDMEESYQRFIERTIKHHAYYRKKFIKAWTELDNLIVVFEDNSKNRALYLKPHDERGHTHDKPT